MGKTKYSNLEKNDIFKKLYDTWMNMRTRCYKEQNKRYKDYGGRGITICEKWKENFIEFYKWAVKNGYKKGLSLDRINNNGNYEPANCKWSTKYEQANNTRRNKKITINNETRTLTQWMKITGLRIDTRLERGWSLEKAITTEKKTKKLLTYNGQTHSISEWGKITGLGKNLRKRLWRGWTLEKALTTPNNKNKARKKANND